jgi:transcriptional regulator with XRE-family HTH domain
MGTVTSRPGRLARMAGQRNLTLRQLARAAGVGHTTVTSINCGRAVRPGPFLRVVATLESIPVAPLASELLALDEAGATTHEAVTAA